MIRIVVKVTELVSLDLTGGVLFISSRRDLVIVYLLLFLLQDYHNVTVILCALFNQGFPFFCTIILPTSFMGSLR
jgi:hypothetical protein